MFQKCRLFRAKVGLSHERRFDKFKTLLKSVPLVIFEIYFLQKCNIKMNLNYLSTSNVIIKPHSSNENTC